MLDSPLSKAELVYFVMVLFFSGQLGVETFRHPNTRLSVRFLNALDDSLN